MTLNVKIDVKTKEKIHTAVLLRSFPLRKNRINKVSKTQHENFLANNQQVNTVFLVNTNSYDLEVCCHLYVTREKFVFCLLLHFGPVFYLREFDKNYKSTYTRTVRQIQRRSLILLSARARLAISFACQFVFSTCRHAVGESNTI